jgi:type II secretory pathway pseudopilin PulG
MQIFNFQFSIFKKSRGFTLVETLVGVALTLIVFMGIFGAYRLGLKVVGLSKNRISATATANSRVEAIRNLAYEQVGLTDAVLPEATGIIERTATQTINDGVYTIDTMVKYAADPADGLGGADSCNLDYKKVDVTVSWGGGFPGSVTFSTDVSPNSLVQEAQSCMSQPGGVLEATIFDFAGMAVASPQIAVFDSATNNLAATATPNNGVYSFLLAVGTYRVEVAKNGYSSARTYSTAEVAVPDSPNPSVLNGSLTPVSLSIDRAGSIAVDGISPTGQGDFADTFADQSLLSQTNSTQVLGDDIVLSGPPYSASGDAFSNAINPADLVSWDSFRFSDDHGGLTNAVYQIFYYDGANWVLVPDSDLAGNAAGFTDSPVDLSGLDKTAYPQLKIKGMLTTSDSGVTPSIHNWQALWTTSTGVAVGNVAFHLQGAKTVGEDADGDRVYKYAHDLGLDANGHLDINDIESDAYTFTVDPANGLSLLGTDHDPQPVNVGPGTGIQVKMFLKAQNALLLTVQNDTTLAPVFSAAVRLYDPGSGYDKTQYTDANGQAYFTPLANGGYNIDVSASGYDAYTGPVTVAGETHSLTGLHQQE